MSIQKRKSRILYAVEVQQQDGSWREIDVYAKQEKAYQVLHMHHDPRLKMRVRKINGNYSKHGFDYDFDED